MATERISNLKAFLDFIEARLSNGGATLSLEEALFEWELENQSDEEQERTIRAIQRGFDDIDAGRVTPAKRAIRGICRKLDLPGPTQ